jgi:lipoprotein-anchoring transpeptidase ErfK/SrfK
MPRWIGLIGSWALLVLAISIAGVAATAEWINMREEKRFDRFDTIDDVLAGRSNSEMRKLQGERDADAAKVQQLQSAVQSSAQKASDLADTDQTIIVSTAENKVWVKRGGQTIYEAICSTGKGTTLIENGRTMVFETPVGKFRILKKEENPKWVPPDWHYVEEARKEGLEVVRLNPGSAIDANTGAVVSSGSNDGPWGWFGDKRTYKVKNNRVVVDHGSYEEELPAGTMLRAGNKLVIPPVGTPQRQFDKVLGSHRLNLGSGYALHGTQAVDQLGRSVSHGCVRLNDKDIAYLYSISNVGDEVIIY